MGLIKIYKITLSPPTLSESKVVIVSYRLASDPDIPASYTVSTAHLVVPVGGILPEPYIIDELDNDKEYVVKVTSDCGNYFFEKNYRTGFACPHIVAGSLRGAVLQEIPATKCADCNFVLNGVPSGQISSMTAGALTSATCNLDDYVIDWFLNNEEVPRFTSGSDINLDDDISVVHPFAGEPVEGGVWHPKIRFVDIDGVRYYGELTVGAKWSPDLLECLPTITVQNYSCSNGDPLMYSPFVGSTYPYTHRVLYTNSVSPSSRAFRSFRFELSSDKRYFAWDFIGEQVYDTLKITYVSPVNNTNTVVEWWRIGYDSDVYTTIGSGIKGYGGYHLFKVKSFAGITYAAGDYLLIEITPNPNTTNTNWTFYCKCLASMDCNIFGASQREIVPNSVFMEWDAATCSYYVNYDRPAYPEQMGTAGHDLFGYHYKILFQYNGGVMTPLYAVGAGYDRIKLQLRKSTAANQFDTGYFWICRQLAGSSTVVKTGNTLVITHTDVNDYNLYKSKYTQAIANPNMSNYSSDVTIVNHYKFFITYVRVANSCGDTQFVRQYYVHYSNPPIFDDANKRVTWNLALMSNQYVSTGACDQTGTALDSVINTNNNIVNSVENYSYTSLISGDQPMSGLYYTQTVLNEMDKIFRQDYVMPVVDTELCDLATKGWNGNYRPYNQWTFPFVYDRVLVTNPADPINNFILYRLMNANGETIPQQKVFEISGGVVVP